MLLKTDKTAYLVNNNGKGKRSISSRIHRKTLRVAGTKPSSVSSGKRVQSGKRISLGKNQKHFNASFPPTTTSLCDNSNDSGLGFDHSESQHILINHQNKALTTVAATNNSYQRSMNTIRYGTEPATSYSTFGRTTAAAASHETKSCIQFGAGKKIKSVIKKPFMPTARNNTNHLTLKTETEDTCGDDFFSTHVHKNSVNNAVSPPTSLNYSPHSSSSSLSEKSSTSSSPVLTSSNRSTPEILSQQLSAPVENNPENCSSEPTSSSPPTSLQSTNHTSVSRDGSIQLQIVTQPEQQHRARYQTEGSRGAVKDKSGNGFPVVKLKGYNKPAILQVFIGNDVGKVSPHIFYQACKVSGKNSTPCNEVKIDGTMVIEIEIKPENDMTVICDCVGILKERNVDVEHRLGKNNSTLASTVTRNKKKSTKCRMIFRAKINESSEYAEILQTCSNIITCTQPPGVPEICKKSLEKCSCAGGKELFIIGKNFLKDTKITFVRFDESNGHRQGKKIWEETVLPDKEYLQQTHLICTVPAYKEEVMEPVHVQFYVTSSNKKSEPHNFVYLPPYNNTNNNNNNNNNISNINSKKLCCCSNGSQDVSSTVSPQLSVLQMTWNLENESQVVTSPENTIMPPPLSGVSSRKPSFSKSLSDTSTNDAHSTNDLQENSTSSPTIQTSPTVSVKEMIYSDAALMSVGYMTGGPSTGLMNTTPLLDEFQVVHHIKSEQNADSQSLPVVLPPPQATPQNTEQNPQQAGELNSAQQQQVVENFINMICAQVEPVIVQQQNNENMITQLSQELIASNNNSVIPTDHTGNLISAISTQQPMICEQNILSVQLDGTNNMIPLHNPLDPSLSNDVSPSNTTLISNAVSEAAAETQAVVKQMIASVAAEMLSENPNETQSSINNFISSTLGPEMGQVAAESSQAQAATTQQQQQQQLQEIIAQELLTPVMIKKEETEGQPQSVQDALINDTVSSNPSTSNITHPFSPTPDFNLTSMSESDLISFINPSVFI